MPKTVSVSAIVPTYNNARTIRACFDSLIRNNVNEIIVVDGGSTDETLEIISQYEPTALLKNERGVGKAKDVGWRASKGELILFLDADAKIHDNAASTLQSHLSQADVAGVCCRVACANQQKLIPRLRDFDFQLAYSRAFHDSKIIDCFADPTICGLFKRTALEAVNGFDSRYPYAEDLELLVKMRSHGYRVLMVYEPAVLHFHRETLRSLVMQFYHHGMGRRTLVDETGSEFHAKKNLQEFAADYLENSLRAGVDIFLCYPFYRMLTEWAFFMGYQSRSR